MFVLDGVLKQESNFRVLGFVCGCACDVLMFSNVSRGIAFHIVLVIETKYWCLD